MNVVIRSPSIALIAIATVILREPVTSGVLKTGVISHVDEAEDVELSRIIVVADEEVITPTILDVVADHSVLEEDVEETTEAAVITPVVGVETIAEGVVEDPSNATAAVNKDTFAPNAHTKTRSHKQSEWRLRKRQEQLPPKPKVKSSLQLHRKPHRKPSVEALSLLHKLHKLHVPLKLVVSRDNFLSHHHNKSRKFRGLQCRLWW